MNQKDFIEKFHTLLPKCQPEAAQLWCDFAAERVEQQQYVHFKAAESRDASVAEWLEVLYKGLHQIRETFGTELAVQVATLSLERCCLYTFARQDKDEASAEAFSEQCVRDVQDVLEGYGCRIEKIDCIAEELEKDLSRGREPQEKRKKGTHHER